jgi:hypothetical protein
MRLFMILVSYSKPGHASTNLRRHSFPVPLTGNDNGVGMARYSITAGRYCLAFGSGGMVGHHHGAP